MGAELLLIVLVAASATAVILQALMFLKTMRSTNELLDRVSSSSDELEREARELVAEVKQIVESVEELKGVFEKLGERGTEVNTLLASRTRDLDELVNHLVQVGTRQAEKVDEVVNDTVEKFEQTTGVIQQDILRPVVEIAAIIKGLRTGLDYLSPRRRDARFEEEPEEELFI